MRIRLSETLGLDDRDVVRVLRSRLFTRSDAGWVPVHRVYAEVLAAEHVAARGDGRRADVLRWLAPDGRWVPAHLQGLARWVAELVPDLAPALVESDPVALASQPAVVHEAHRARWLDAIVGAHEAGRADLRFDLPRDLGFLASESSFARARELVDGAELRLRALGLSVLSSGGASDAAEIASRLLCSARAPLEARRAALSALVRTGERATQTRFDRRPRFSVGRSRATRRTASGANCSTLYGRGGSSPPSTSSAHCER